MKVAMEVTAWILTHETWVVLCLPLHSYEEWLEAVASVCLLPNESKSYDYLMVHVMWRCFAVVLGDAAQVRLGVPREAPQSAA